MIKLRISEGIAKKLMMEEKSDAEKIHQLISTKDIENIELAYQLAIGQNLVDEFKKSFEIVYTPHQIIEKYNTILSQAKSYIRYNKLFSIDSKKIEQYKQLLDSLIEDALIYTFQDLIDLEENVTDDDLSEFISEVNDNQISDLRNKIETSADKLQNTIDLLHQINNNLE